MDPVAHTAARTAPSFDGTVFRQVIGNFMSGVVVITTTDGERNHGMTVSAISSLSLEPPLLLVCLNVKSRTQEVVHSAGRFAVNILTEHQGHIAERFAGSRDDKFTGVPVRTGRTGVPVLADALAIVECRVAEVVTGGTHRVFIAEVVQAEAGEGAPLAYFRGKFGRFELAQDAEVYRLIRDLVLSRAIGASQPLNVEQLAQQLDAPLSAVYYALSRLVGENLVIRDANQGHLVAPLNAAASDDAHDAKLAMELGAAELTVGRLTSEQLSEFRRLAEATIPLIDGGHFTDVTAYVRANARFHAYLIELTGISALVDAYDQLSIQELMARALSAQVDVSHQLVDDHRELVDAYDRGDLDAVKRIVVAHNERAKATQRAGIERAGGAL